ncbi:hypothetical protein DUNSADRAFT_6158 [Dunaliella salina]|uniref:Uncharacterized protein n=1 Tax=Dunaliella salina TaxID=3046 RepID=A0ABQ7FTZ3_DUNSA|nr:hypothetical protein DUNSADRAFT_6158 [Dunaliella salina]|eukprot:KAF5825887.1 hypothetical protein DUNSADRAFT_6158 [Dunaliella salina]
MKDFASFAWAKHASYLLTAAAAGYLVLSYGHVLLPEKWQLLVGRLAPLLGRRSRPTTYNSILELIGNTPFVRIDSLSRETGCVVGVEKKLILRTCMLLECTGLKKDHGWFGISEKLQNFLSFFYIIPDISSDS